MSTPQPGGSARLRVGALGLALLVLLPGLVVAGAWPAPWVFLGLATAAAAVDLWLDRREPALSRILGVAQFGVSQRSLVQVLGLAVLVARTSSDGSRRSHLEVSVLVLLCAAMPIARTLYQCLLAVWRRRSHRQVQVRNIDLGAYAAPPPPPLVLTASVGRRATLLGAAPVLLGALGAALDRPVVLVVAVGCYLALLLGAGLVVGRAAVRTRRVTATDGLDGLLGQVRAARPEVVLYFSGSADSTYQVAMWLDVLARTGRRCLVLVRERHTFEALPATELPVVHAPAATTVMRLELDEARVALYTANTGKNIHLLREPGLKHVFIGHGDSDKVSSFNPFSRVYDEIWVAGQAGRDRYARARIGVRDEQVVEVGRPQLDGISHTARHPAGRAVVLYAPTWEGWNDEEFATSITAMGPALVAALVAREDVRVIYKPHPLTGLRDPLARAAHQRIVALVEAAAGGHTVVVGAEPTLYACFDEADLMIADVSSVVSDFVASGKPYACANPRELDHAAFHGEFPTTAAGYVLDPDLRQLDDVVASALAAPGQDRLAAARASLRTYLLGPATPAIERWNAAVEALVRAPRSGPDDLVGRVAVDEEELLDEQRHRLGDDETAGDPEEAGAR